MEWEVIDIKKMKKQTRFTIQLDYHRYNILLQVMEFVNTKQRSKAIKFLLDKFEEIKNGLIDDLEKIVEE